MGTPKQNKIKIFVKNILTFFRAKTYHNGDPGKVSEAIVELCWHTQTSFLSGEQEEKRNKIRHD